MTNLRHWSHIVAAVLLCVTVMGYAVSAASPSAASRYGGSGKPNTNPLCDPGVFAQQIGDKLIYTVTDRATLLNLAKQYGWAASKGNATISEAVFVIDQQSVPSMPKGGPAHSQGTPSAGASPLWGIPKDYIQITGTGWVCDGEVLRDSYYYGPATATMIVTESVPAEWSASAGISASLVNAGVGFDVTKSYTVSGSHSIKVPAGHLSEIIAHPIYYAVNFDIWQHPVIGDPYRIGYGYAMKPIGACFVQYRSPA